MTQNIINTIIEQISADGHRLTRQKRLVIESIAAHPHEHMSVENIYNYTQIHSTDISLTTVYRVVKFLTDNNILRKLNIYNDNNYYELIQADANMPHPHFICQQCGKIFDLDLNDILPQINKCQQHISKNYNFKIESSTIFYYGIGPDCRKPRLYK
ncbi:Fur family transcriptional regulator [Pectinatus brassicae]|uniref:Fur family ferric uptake transcriptional regulator n=1 Tax=Pectinatus brassicae TaxID=862415 RepID=A0A840UJG7_9FIRM|nr:Fur family transcriptional regulator [Pectinatus brassicae]MBB5337139.1 Fur family ferric uptake transcriptional regulator [Pectinatus brassicae]